MRYRWNGWQKWAFGLWGAGAAATLAGVGLLLAGWLASDLGRWIVGLSCGLGALTIAAGNTLHKIGEHREISPGDTAADD